MKSACCTPRRGCRRCGVRRGRGRSRRRVVGRRGARTTRIESSHGACALARAGKTHATRTASTSSARSSRPACPLPNCPAPSVCLPASQGVALRAERCRAPLCERAAGREPCDGARTTGAAAIRARQAQPRVTVVHAPALSPLPLCHIAASPLSLPLPVPGGARHEHVVCAGARVPWCARVRVRGVCQNTFHGLNGVGFDQKRVVCLSNRPTTPSHSNLGSGASTLLPSIVTPGRARVKPFPPAPRAPRAPLDCRSGSSASARKLRCSRSCPPLPSAWSELVGLVGMRSR